jgi:hypothetical protein
MRMVDAKGKPLGRRYYCPEDGKTLSSSEMVRGYEVKKEKMVVVTEEELDAIAPEMTRDITCGASFYGKKFQRPTLTGPISSRPRAGPGRHTTCSRTL